MSIKDKLAEFFGKNWERELLVEPLVQSRYSSVLSVLFPTRKDIIMFVIDNIDNYHIDGRIFYHETENNTFECFVRSVAVYWDDKLKQFSTLDAIKYSHPAFIDYTD